MANGLPNPTNAQDDLDQDSQPQVPDLAKLLALAYPGSRAEAETPYGQAQATQRAAQAARDQSFLNAIQAKKNKDIQTPPTYESIPTQDADGNYSIQKQLTPEAATQQAMEWGKILSPANAAAAQGTGAAQINRAADLESMQALQQLLASGKLPSGTHVTGGHGVGITTPTINQQIPPAAVKEVADLQAKKKQPRMGVLSMPFDAQYNAGIDKQINEVYARYGFAPPGSPQASAQAGPSPAGTKMRVQLADGRTGTIDSSEFDPSTMKQIQ